MNKILSFPHSGDENFIEMVGNDIWLMDCHKWSYYVWEKLAIERTIHNSVLFHLDYHWDGINDFQKPEDLQKLVASKTLKDIDKLYNVEGLVRYDSFISPAIIRGIIDEVHFYCFQDDTDEGICETILDKYPVKQVIHKDLADLLAIDTDKDILLDIDLDLFNKSEQYLAGDLWSNDQINDFINSCSRLTTVPTFKG